MHRVRSQENFFRSGDCELLPTGGRQILDTYCSPLVIEENSRDGMFSKDVVVWARVLDPRVVVQPCMAPRPRCEVCHCWKPGDTLGTPTVGIIGWRQPCGESSIPPIGYMSSESHLRLCLLGYWALTAPLEEEVGVRALDWSFMTMQRRDIRDVSSSRIRWFRPGEVLALGRGSADAVEGRQIPSSDLYEVRQQVVPAPSMRPKLLPGGVLLLSSSQKHHSVDNRAPAYDAAEGHGERLVLELRLWDAVQRQPHIRNRVERPRNQDSIFIFVEWTSLNNENIDLIAASQFALSLVPYLALAPRLHTVWVLGESISNSETGDSTARDYEIVFRVSDTLPGRNGSMSRDVQSVSQR